MDSIKIQYNFLREIEETDKIETKYLTTCELLREITGVKNLNELNILKSDIETYAASNNQIKPRTRKSRKLEASIELGKRYCNEYGRKTIRIKKAADVLNIIGYEYRYSEQENLIVLSLNGGNEVINFNVVSKGTANQTQIHPREIFKNAIRCNAVSIIMIHNHPSGNLKPSQQDITGTRTIKEAGRILGINLLDHLIVGPVDDYESISTD